MEHRTLLAAFAAGLAVAGVSFTVYLTVLGKQTREAMSDKRLDDRNNRTPTRAYDNQSRRGSSEDIGVTSPNPAGGAVTPHPTGGASFRSMGESPRVAGTRRMAPPVIVGVAGASGSGKTCIASLIEKRLQGVSVVSISSDSYYRGLKEGSDASKHNWDHPDALDLDLLSQHLMDLREGRDVQVPVYNFSTHSRDKVNAVFVSAHDTDVIIVDGIFVLCVEKLRKAFDLTLFTVEDLDVCLVRRLRRDIAERGRSIESVLLQYMMFVRPGYTNFIEPSRSFADILVPRARDNHIAIEMVAKEVARRVGVAQEEAKRIVDGASI